MGTPFTAALEALTAAETAYRQARNDATQDILATREPIRKRITDGLLEGCDLQLYVTASRDESRIYDGSTKSDLTVSYQFSLMHPLCTPVTVNTISCARETRFTFDIITPGNSGVPEQDNPEGKQYAFPRISGFPMFKRAGAQYGHDHLTDGAQSKLRAELFAHAAELTKQVDLNQHIIPAVRAELTRCAMNEVTRFRQPDGSQGRGILIAPMELSFSADELQSGFHQIRRECYQLNGQI